MTTPGEPTRRPSAAWRVVVPENGIAALHRHMLGLTFLERRLREARQLGIEHVQLVASSPLPPGALPPLRDPTRCAPWSVVGPAEQAPAADVVHEVELFAVVDHQPPHASLLSLDPQGDWTPAIRRHKQHIVATTGAGWVGRALNKPISLAVSTRLARTRLTPNQWSYLNLAVGLASGWLVAQPEYLAVLMGGLLFQLASVFDGVDGEIAKFRLESSRFGAWLDTFVDNLTLLVFFAGCGAHVLRFGGLEPAGAAVLAAIWGGSIVAYLAMQMLFVRHRLNEGSLVAWDGRFLQRLPVTDPVVWFVRKARHFFKKDFFSLLFFSICASGQLVHLFHIATAGCTLMFASVSYLNVRYWSLAHEGAQTSHL